MKQATPNPRYVPRLLRAWFSLTRDEQLALLLVLGLLLLGLGMRGWHLSRLPPDALSPDVPAQNANDTPTEITG